MNPALPVLGLLASLGAASFAVAAVPASNPDLLSRVRPGQTVHGFRAEAVYTDAADRPIGGRFVHRRTGFTFDALQIESVPQGFIWVSSFPNSDRGEPHTQEHLLLGKGNKGRFVADLENLSLGQSSAFVSGWRTAYHFNVAAGADVYYRLFEEQLDALLHPDYTDEEIRREVRNFGVTENPDGTLRLEEKGTVYNEMVSSFERPTALPYRALQQMLYGPEHPLSWSAGGFPAAIREMTPEHIRRFHADHYQLANMGMVGAYPRSMPLEDVLRRTDRALVRLQGRRPAGRGFVTEATLPRFQAAPAGEIRVVDYPHQNPQQPSALYLAWPAQLELEPRERLLLSLFLSNLAGDPTTNLYRVFVDTRTREMDLGARSVGGWVSGDVGHAVVVSFADVAPDRMTPETVALVRDRVVEEIRRVAALEPGSPELEEFNRRLAGRVVEMRRGLANFVNSPPGFGLRSSGPGWISHLHDLNRTAEFRKSLVLRPELAWVEALLEEGGNPWRSRAPAWRLTEAVPYAVAARPSPDLVRREAEERAERTVAELASLGRRYGTADDQETIRRYAAEYDAETARLDAIAAEAPRARFIDTPPMTLDDGLEWRRETLAGEVPLVASTFESMTSATTGLALRLDGVADADLLYLAVLPALLTQTGVIRDGVPVSFNDMREALRHEVLGLNAYFSANPRTGRAELVVRGAGNDLGESLRSVEWMRRVVTAPNWTEANLPRIRDVVDQSLAGLRSTMQRSEESWVQDPATAWRRQDDALLLATQSFLTRTHAAHRLRWMLKELPADPGGAAMLGYLETLASAGERGSRADLQALLSAVQRGEGTVAPALAPLLEAFRGLPPEARSVAVDAARDLELTLAEVPDASLAADWSYLARQMSDDLAVPPSRTLAELERVRQGLLRTGGARMFMVGSAASQAGLRSGVESLVAALEPGALAPARRAGGRLVAERLLGRDATAIDPLHVGLVNPNTQGGVFLNSSPLAGYGTTDRESLLEFLAAKLYAGGGAHSMFMKTWGAGLAYSNGLRSSPATGRLTYYAERVPELPQTLRFVIDELKAGPRDPSYVEYAIAQGFGELRSPQSYEARAEAMAADLADGQTPERVREFRTALLALRGEPGLVDEVFDRMERVYGRVLPGYGPSSREVEGGVFFVIGPERQMRLWQEHLEAAEGPGTRLHRLFPRDFWHVAPPASR
jgi:Zn-dependent M16 (insulinase) family peptidase